MMFQHRGGAKVEPPKQATEEKIQFGLSATSTIKLPGDIVSIKGGPGDHEMVALCHVNDKKKYVLCFLGQDSEGNVKLNKKSDPFSSEISLYIACVSQETVELSGGGQPQTVGIYNKKNGRYQYLGVPENKFKTVDRKVTLELAKGIRAEIGITFTEDNVGGPVITIHDDKRKNPIDGVFKPVPIFESESGVQDSYIFQLKDNQFVIDRWLFKYVPEHGALEENPYAIIDAGRVSHCDEVIRIDEARLLCHSRSALFILDVSTKERLKQVKIEEMCMHKKLSLSEDSSSYALCYNYRSEEFRVLDINTLQYYPLSSDDASKLLLQDRDSILGHAGMLIDKEKIFFAKDNMLNMCTVRKTAPALSLSQGALPRPGLASSTDS